MVKTSTLNSYDPNSETNLKSETALKPSDRVIKNILNFSKSLNVKSSESIGKVVNVMN